MFPSAATVRTILVPGMNCRMVVPSSIIGVRIPPQEGRAVLAIDGLGLPVMRSFMIGISSGQPTLPTFPGCERRSTEKCAVNEEYSHGAP